MVELILTYLWSRFQGKNIYAWFVQWQAHMLHGNAFPIGWVHKFTHFSFAHIKRSLPRNKNFSLFWESFWAPNSSKFWSFYKVFIYKISTLRKLTSKISQTWVAPILYILSFIFFFKGSFRSKHPIYIIFLPQPSTKHWKSTHLLNFFMAFL